MVGHVKSMKDVRKAKLVFRNTKAQENRGQSPNKVGGSYKRGPK